jgi:hypothetical protein
MAHLAYEARFGYNSLYNHTRYLEQDSFPEHRQTAAPCATSHQSARDLFLGPFHASRLQ